MLNTLSNKIQLFTSSFVKSLWRKAFAKCISVNVSVNKWSQHLIIKLLVIYSSLKHPLRALAGSVRGSLSRKQISPACLTCLTGTISQYYPATGFLTQKLRGLIETLTIWSRLKVCREKRLDSTSDQEKL